jgi:hypothetical protein
MKMRKLLLTTWLTAATATPSVIWVNDDAGSYTAPATSCTDAGYAKIQAAIDAAASGDTINVCPGTYVENLTVNKSDLTIASTNGAPVTVIRAAVSYHVVQITSPNVTLQGFTIVPFGSADGDIGVNVAIEGSTGAVIARNVIRGGRIGINLGCASSGSTVIHNVVSSASEAGINVDTCESPPFPGSGYNSVHHNIVCGGIFPYSIAVGGSSNNNAVHHNTGIWISVGGTGNTVHHNTATLFLIAPGNTSFANNVADLCQGTALTP